MQQYTNMEYNMKISNIYQNTDKLFSSPEC